MRSAIQDEIPMWSLSDRTKVPVTEMKTVHIKNCIQMLERKGFVPETSIGIILSRSGQKRTSKWLNIFYDELAKRGEIDGDNMRDN
jgi:hypothetical protein